MKREALAAVTAETIKLFHEVYLVEIFGADAGLVPPETLQQLFERRILDPAMLGGLKIEAGSMTLDPFLFLRMAGRAMDDMDPDELAQARDWTLDEWRPFVAAQIPEEMEQTGAEVGGVVEVGKPAPPEDVERPAEAPHSPRWLSEQERAAHSEALARAGDYARGLGNAFAADGRESALEGWQGEEISEEVDPETRESMRRIIREETAQAIVGPRDARTLAGNLADRTGHYSHNWMRIANTELQGSHNAGRVTDAIKANGAGALIARITESGACPHCLRLFRDADGLPNIFSAAELLANGTNVGLKPDAWKPTIWPVHPNCQCDTLPIPEGFYVTESGRIRKRKEPEESEPAPAPVDDDEDL